MHVMAARQLTGEADAIQLPGSELGLCFNIGGGAGDHGALYQAELFQLARAIRNNGISWTLGRHRTGRSI